MKIDGIDPVTNSQHRLLAEGARKQHAAEHGQTAQAKQLTENQVKAPRPADESGQSPAQNPAHDKAQASQQADQVELQNMASQVRQEFAAAGVVPAPNRFAGVSLVSSVDVVRAGSDKAPQVSPMHRAQMIMVRQLIRRMTGRDLQVQTPGELSAEMKSIEKDPPAEPPKSQTTGPAQADPFDAPVIIRTPEGQTIETTMAVDTGGAHSRQDAQTAEPLLVPLDAPAEEVPDGRFEFRVEFQQQGSESGQALRVYARRPGSDEQLVAVGDRNSGAVYIGHLHDLPGFQARPAAQNRAPAAIEDAAEPISRLDVSL
ncbi:MAG: hypothetical protein ACLFUJ_12930 [Phycisphaerae bacterium]